MIRVLCDAIHADLWESLRLLFEVRLGMELYRPIGMEWQEAGLWRFEQGQPYGLGVAHQFLDQWHDDEPVGGYATPPSIHTAWTERRDTTHPGQVQRLVTMSQARELGFDLVLCTLAENEYGFRAFADELGAHYGIQVGNQGADNKWGAAEFALLSVTTPGFTPWKPHVYYRQEFDLELFAPDRGAGAEPDLVMNRVQCTSQTGGHYDRFLELSALLAGVARLRWYGHCEPRDDLWGGDDPTTPAVAASMHRARVAYHPKMWSDGYGHVIHNWFSIGRPVLATAGYYEDKLAGPLFVEGVTSFDLQRMSTLETATTITRLIRDDELWLRMSDASAARFREVVNFDAEAEQIRAMLDNVLSDRLAR